MSDKNLTILLAGVESDEEKTLVTNDKNIKPDSDEAKALTEGGYIVVKSVEQLKEMARAAHETMTKFERQISAQMTPARAERIRRLRVDEGYTWRAVAAMCHSEWDDAAWKPPSNQLAGMALCKYAAEQFGEDYYDDGTWN